MARNARDLVGGRPLGSSDEPLVGGGSLREFGDGRLIEDRALGGPDMLPDGREDLRSGLVRLARRLTRAIDRREDFSERDLTRRPGESIAAGSPSSAVDQARPLQL